MAGSQTSARSQRSQARKAAKDQADAARQAAEALQTIPEGTPQTGAQDGFQPGGELEARRQREAAYMAANPRATESEVARHMAASPDAARAAVTLVTANPLGITRTLAEDQEQVEDGQEA
jgi:hypothetical protein